ncbi:hypothetical protein BLA29_000531 [Euroglyphus maynei]|uniref:Uncharacterized protein n=1 Tax=Euroglyphus maynei TaxID=6958 RepID=A0A1Y3BC14_EURMA|nr:hypothetical protein BLA29_000531 [Euroglyphus maynei]
MASDGMLVYDAWVRISDDVVAELENVNTCPLVVGLLSSEMASNVMAVALGVMLVTSDVLA